MSQLTQKKNPQMNLFKVFFFFLKMQRDIWISWEHYGFHKLGPGEKSILSTFRKPNKYLKSSHNNHYKKKNEILSDSVVICIHSK